MSRPNTRRLAALAIAGGMAFIVVAWIGATNPPFHGHLDTTVEYLSDAFFSAALALTIPGLVALRRLQGAPRAAVETAVAGQLLVLIGVAAGLMLGESPSWFAAVGVPGVLLWLVGTVRIAKHTWRARILPRWSAVAIALTVPVGVVLGEFGGSALPGLLWIYLGLRLVPSRELNLLRRMPAAGGVLVALGVCATPALGGTYTLNLTAPSAAGVGQPTIIQASGSNPPDDFFNSWLAIHAIPTSVLSTCPADENNAFQIASSTSAQGGEVVTNHQREDVDAAGNFSMPVAHTPRKPGRFLLCGYTDDGATTTLAASSLILSVQGGPGTGADPPASQPAPVARPANLTRPRVTRSARRLVCGRGSWSNNPSRYSYRWLVNGKRRRGATGRTLAVTRAVRGRRVHCRVTAFNAVGATTALSRPLRIR